MNKTWYGDHRCPVCQSTYRPIRSSQVYCCRECRQSVYYQNQIANKPKKKMTKDLKQELNSYISLVLNPQTKGYPYVEVWKYFNDKGLVNENSLIINLNNHGFKVVNGMVIKT